MERQGPIGVRCLGCSANPMNGNLMMNILNFIHTMLQLQIIAWLLIPSICSGSENTNLSISLLPSKEVIFLGEPIQLLVGLENKSKGNISIDSGPNYVEAFSIEIRDAQGRTRGKQDIQKLEGFRQTGRLDIPAGSTVRISLPLHRWCSTTLPEGHYKIVCHFKPWLEPSIKPVDSSCDLEIVKVDEGELNKIFLNLTEQAINSTNCDERRSPYEMVALSDSPLAIKYQLQLVRTIPDGWRCYHIDSMRIEKMIDSLKKNGSPEAVKELVSICDDTSLEKDDRERALVAIRELQNTGDPHILQATEAIINKYGNQR